MIRLLAILLIVVALVWALRRLLGRSVAPSVSRARPPLVVEPEDPLMLEATARARSSLDDFERLLSQENRGARVKVRVRTDTGAEEQLWADVVAVVGSQVEARLDAQPVTQREPLPGLQRFPLSDVLDWQVELPDGSYAGGHTVRAMFRKGREQWGALPEDLAAEERRYR